MQLPHSVDQLMELPKMWFEASAKLLSTVGIGVFVSNVLGEVNGEPLNSPLAAEFFIQARCCHGRNLFLSLWGLTQRYNEVEVDDQGIVWDGNGSL